MFDLRIFVFNTLKSMLGNEPEYKVRQYASGWFDKQVLTLDDLKFIDDFYANQEEIIEPNEVK